MATSDHDLDTEVMTVQARLLEGHDVNAIAAELEVSVDVLIRRFKRATGHTPKQWAIANREAAPSVQVWTRLDEPTHERLVAAAEAGGVTPAEYVRAAIVDALARQKPRRTRVS